MRHAYLPDKNPELLADTRFATSKSHIAPHIVWLIVSILGLIPMLVAPGLVRAHEGRPVGPTLFEVGFQEEPAVEGVMNGVELHVELPDGSSAAPELVEGLDATLKVEVTHVASDVSMVMDLQAVPGEPGHYTADFIPTVPGQYRMRFFGTIGDLSVDESFESGTGTFSDVVAAADFQFPQPVPQAREFENAIRGAQESVAATQDSAATATLMAAAALALGAIGAAAGILALLTVRKRL